MMAAQSQLQKPVFTLKLKDSKGGKLSFGSIDREQYKGDLMTSPVNNETHSAWVVDEVTLASGKAKITQPMLFGKRLVCPETYRDNMCSICSYRLTAAC